MTIAEARNLHAGDEVTWEDPDDGACSDTFRIATLEEFPGGVFRIQKECGGSLEAFNHELH